jgi:glycosyltransferase involved in cell wall biosynthesis
VVLEAMAMGIPVIATAWGGPQDYLDESCGMLVQPTSEADMVAGFARGMQALGADRELCGRLGRAGRDRVVAQYDWDKKIDAMMAVYQGLAK